MRYLGRALCNSKICTITLIIFDSKYKRSAIKIVVDDVCLGALFVMFWLY